VLADADPRTGYIDLRGHQVWTKEWENNGEPVVLLHGGLSKTEGFDWAVLPAVEHDHHVFAYDRTAHGHTGIRDGFYHFDFQTDEAIAFLEDVVKGPAHLIGWSDGGIISLMVAIKRPDLVKSIVAIGTNYHYDCGLSIEEGPIEISDEDKAWFEANSPDGSARLKEVIQKAFDVWKSEPNMTVEQLAIITCPVLVLTGDDEPFSNHHTIDLYEALPNGRLAIVPGTSHHVIRERSDLACIMIEDFYQRPGYPMTKSPRLRAARTAELQANLPSE